jgi:protein SCO1/2
MVSSVLKAAFRIKAGWLFFLWLLCACKSRPNYERLPFYNTADFTAEWVEPNDKAYASIHRIDHFALQDQSGHLFNSDSLKGKIYTANFFFTACPSICPKMVNNLKTLQDSFRTNNLIQMVSFSVTPQIDSVPRLATYGESMEIDPAKWHLLTGNKGSINTLGRQSFFAEKKEGLLKDSSEFLHTEILLLIDQQARIRGVYKATVAADIAKAISDIKTLLKE